MVNNQFYGRGKGGDSWFANICQFLWCQYSHYSQLQTTTRKLLNVELGRNTQ